MPILPLACAPAAAPLLSADAGQAHQRPRADDAVGYQPLGELKLFHLAQQRLIEQRILVRIRPRGPAPARVAG